MTARGSRRLRGVRGLAVGGGVLIALAALAHGGGIRGRFIEQGVRAAFGIGTGGPPAEGTVEQRVAGLCVRSPRAFARLSDPTTGSVMRGGVDRTELYQVSTGDLRLQVTQVLYMPSVRPSLQAAVDGYVSELVRLPSTRAHSYENRAATVSTYPALRTTARFHAKGLPMRAEAVTFASNRMLWQVQALFPYSEPTEEAALGVLASVAVQEPTPPGDCPRHGVGG